MSENTGLEEFRALRSSTGRCVVATVKKDGRPQLSTVDYCWDDDRLLRFSTTADRAKVHNLRRDPRVSVQISSADGASYAVFEGVADLTPVSASPDDATVEELIDVFRAVNGEHPDWAEYRAAMVADRRLVVRVRLERAYGYIRPRPDPPEFRGAESDKPRLHVLIASTRPERTGPAVANWITPIAKGAGLFDVHLIDLADFDLPLLDEPNHPADRSYTKRHTLEWSASVAAADAFVFVAPEYNYGINAALKNALDYLYYEWQYKPVGFVSYGNTSGGLRAQQMTKQVVTTLKMVPVSETVAIHYVSTYVDEEGRFTGTEAHADAAHLMLTELHKLAEILAPLRARA